MKKCFALIFMFPFLTAAQLELAQIMKGNEFIGHLPQNIRWDISGEKVCYDLLQGKELKTLCYNHKTKIIDTASENLIYFDRSQSSFDRQYEINNNEISCWDKKQKKKSLVFSSVMRISNLQRVNDQSQIYFQIGKDLFQWTLGESTKLQQVTNFVDQPIEKASKSQGYLFEQQQELFDYFSEDETSSQVTNGNHKLKSIYTGIGDVISMEIHPREAYVLLKKHKSANQKETSYMSFVNADGYTMTKKARPKVSVNEPRQSLGVFSRDKDTLIWVDFSTLTGLQVLAPYTGDSDSLEFPEDRHLWMNNTLFFEEKEAAILDIRSADNKDRWIVLLNLKNASITELVHEHDEAWIGGPGISSWNMAPGYFSWWEEDELFLFQSERTGYSHLYSYNLSTKQIDAKTSGDFEVRSIGPSKYPDKRYITCNKTHPGDRNVFELNLKDNSMKAIFNEEGAHELVISPDESYFAYRYSSSNRPWELYLNRNKPGSKAIQVTNSTSEEFNAYNWIKPKSITFEASDGNPVHARLYEPSKEKKNGAAVFFVHGAGYLQNAHHFWSGYYREYMFHNLLMEKGFTVLDVDYRASDGYGRDYRTAIYRHMGGRDLMDYIDAKKYVVNHLDIDANRIGIYGGSYGGFITLMALLTQPDEFACGAALRSVTDWAHYNHEYTSNILNYPETDSLAYRRSSPIYFAENLERPLLMLHGMEDNNVQFQDVVRLSQRFIELGKKNWELAVFPIEAHGFKEASSWTDEYRRILELFEKYLK